MESSFSILSELNYLPPISWFILCHDASELVFDVHGHYQKGSWRNRCYVAGPNGILMLSVPLERGKNERRAYKDVRISNDFRWQQEHWRTLSSCYRRSAYFEYFEEDLAPLFEKKFDFLTDWNLALLAFLKKPIKYRWSVSLSDNYIVPGTASMKDIRSYGVQDEQHALAANQIQPYRQVFNDRFPFQKNLSIIDLLFNQGKFFL
jgi:hypothetical protein